MKKFAAILRDIGFVFFVVFILLMIFLMSSGKHISIAGYQVLRVLTSSMEPTISENTCIIIKKVPVEDLKVGDVITFTSDDPQIQGLYNTHRIHDIVEENGETLYVTKGDAIDAVDAYPVHQDQVAGIYVRELPGGRLLGKCFVALSDNRVYFLVIMLPLMLCLMSYFWQIMGIFRKSDEELEEDEEAQEAISEGENSGEGTTGESVDGLSEEETTGESIDGSSEDDTTGESAMETSEVDTTGESAMEISGNGNTGESEVEITAEMQASSELSEEEDYHYTEEDYLDEDYRYDFTKDNK